MNLNCDGRGAWLLGVWAGLGPCGLQPRALVVAALFDALSILVRFAFGMRGCALVSRLRSPIVDLSCDAQGGGGARVADGTQGGESTGPRRLTWGTF